MIEIKDKLILAKPVVDLFHSYFAETLPRLNNPPTLAVILVGDDPASSIYVDKKEKACKKIGFCSVTYRPNPDRDEVLNLIDKLNKDNSINGILVQLPLPSGIDPNLVIDSIDPLKDVDGLHPINSGLLSQGRPRFIPCTPLGIIYLLMAYGIETEGRHIVVLGRSNLVGRPIATLLSLKLKIGNATVTICHSKTRDMKQIANQADILIAAMGQPLLIDADYIKEGAYVFDVGIHRLDSGSICGDVRCDDIMNKVAAITPVPKGVGPMTITCLLYNTIKAACIQSGIDFRDIEI